MTHIHIKKRLWGTCSRCKSTKANGYVERYKTRSLSRYASVFDEKVYCEDCYNKYFVSRGKE